MNVHQYSSANALVDAFAEWLVTDIAQTLLRQKRYALCLSGGSTPKALHQLLATPAFASRIDWSKLHIFWGDERFVPFSDERNNARMAYDTLLNFVPIPPHYIHCMDTSTATAEQSALAYASILHQYFNDTPFTFDLVLLGMGDDAHTLSLFPGQPVIDEAQNWTASLWLQSQQMHRVTLTAPVVNRAAAVAFLVTGSSKRPALHKVWHGTKDVMRYPAQIIAPHSGNLHWWVDDAAVGEAQ
ncbi:MAG: 6-phosphogluconolactonase [Bacteroidetes bacterium]|nr:MAG: 6-phosphogluconolactonase [Bacteroidota bacterium]